MRRKRIDLSVLSVLNVGAFLIKQKNLTTSLKIYLNYDVHKYLTALIK